MARAKKTETVAAEVSVPQQSRTLSVIIVFVVLLSLSLGVAGYFYYQYKSVLSTNGEATKREADEISRLTEIIGAIMELPQGETPTLATVKDRDKLAEQPFFQKAENGDKVLIYVGSGRAILYRPSTKKIIDMTTVNVNPASQTTEEAVVTAAMPANDTPDTVEKTVIQAASIALYNGSTKVGVTNNMESKIAEAFPDVTVELKEKAAKDDYTSNLIADLSGTHAELTQKLAESIGGTVVPSLPDGETKPEADILVIVGNK